MTELTIALLSCALGALIWALIEQRTDRTQRRAVADAIEAERKHGAELLAKAAAANETLGTELARQRDHLASLEMRLGATAPRSFTPGR